MSESEELIGKLMEAKPELDRQTIDEEIRKKKEKIGAGYLTDKGAVFLIAADHGITLAETSGDNMSLKDIYVGASDVSLETRVMNLSPAKQFERKDGTPFYLRTMTVYDNNSTASVKLWDEKANLPGIADLRPGDLIKIIKAYVKSDFNGSPTINIGSGSSIESADAESSIPTIDSMVTDVSRVSEEKNDIVVSGTIDGQINLLEYTSKRGNPATALRLRLRGADGNSMRIVLWGKDEKSIPKMIMPNAKAVLYGVRAKIGNQGDIEIHGNESTLLDIEGDTEVRPVTLRLISTTRMDSDDILALGIDSDENLITVKDLSGNLAQYGAGDVIECMPSKAYGNALTMDSGSFARKMDDDGSVPSMEKIRTKIANVKVGSICCVEGVVLKKPDPRDIETKTGDTVTLGEMYIEDDTAEIWVKGWRKQAGQIAKCSTGEVITITGVFCKAGLEGKPELSLGAFSTVTKKSE